MTEIIEPRVLHTAPKRRKIRITDFVVFGVILIVIVVLAMTLINKLGLKHDVSAAQVVSDKTISAIQKRDGAAAHALGDKQFQAKNSAADLTALFKKEQIATLKSPTLDRTAVYTSKTGKTVFFIYRYSALKVPFYIRTGIAQSNGQWKLTNLSGSADESKLIVN